MACTDIILCDSKWCSALAEDPTRLTFGPVDRRANSTYGSQSERREQDDVEECLLPFSKTRPVIIVHKQNRRPV